MLTIINVLQNLNREKRMELKPNEYRLLMEYIYFWNNHGRDTNVITPRNTAMCNSCSFSEPTFYKYRKALVEKGFIIVKSFEAEKGCESQKPAEISLADWLIKSNKVVASTPDEVMQKAVKMPRKPVLDDYAKDMAVQIGAGNQAIYPKQINRIKVLETKTSKEVIKLVREYVKEYSNSNAFAYYEATLRNIINAGVKTVTELGAYNPRIAKKPVQQQLPLMGVVHKNKRAKTNYYKGKRVEQGTDWSQKKAKVMSDEEYDKSARTYLGMAPDEEFTGVWASMTPDERFCKALHESFLRAENKNVVEA